MDSAQLRDLRDGDHQEEPLATPQASGSPAVHYVDPRDDSHNHIPHSPQDDDEGMRHRHVPLGYFDPSGVDELKRTMSRVSERHAPSTHLEPSSGSRLSSAASEHTLTPGDGPFDFEKALQRSIRRCVKTSLSFSQSAYPVGVQVGRV